MPHVPRAFRHGETIHAVLKLVAGRPLTAAELERLMARFAELNGDRVPRPGETCLIPTPDEGAADTI
jgi:hypothetical protein